VSAASPEELAFTAYLRVAAMAAVVLIHSMSAIVGNPAIRGSTSWWAATALDLGVAWAVPLFIMISGALLLAPHPNEGAGDFYRRRLHRIGIPLIVAHVGYFAVRAILLHQSLTPQVVLRDLLRASAYTQLYFFWIILGLYIVTPLLRLVIANVSHRQLVAVGFALAAWMWAVGIGVRILQIGGISASPWQPAAFALWIPYLGYFVLGYAMRGLILRGWRLATALAVFLVGDAVVIWQFRFGVAIPVTNVALGGGYQGLPVAATAIALFLIGRAAIHPASALAESRLAMPMRRLGELTLGVFIVFPLAFRAGWLVPGLAFGQVKHSLPGALLLWAIVVVASFAMCMVIARIPILRRAIGF
jgi:surface polysaccharide O-acyltransferase-like enzyme